MELEPNTTGDKSPDISDEARLLASAKQTTVTPLHDDIEAESEPDELIANQHILQGPIANSASESESTVGNNPHALLHKEVAHPILVVCLGITIALCAVALIIIH